jgi:multisubunit Na+/H+ antiporter MnhG subunit
MDTAWLEVLPMPKSRPGWITAFFLAILGLILLWITQPVAHDYLLDAYYRTDEQAYYSNKVYMLIHTTTPRFVDAAEPYPIEVEVTRLNYETDFNLSSIQVAQRAKDSKSSDSVKINFDPEFNLEFVSNTSFKNRLLLTAPKGAKNDTQLNLTVQINTTGNLHNSEMITTRPIPVNVNHWRVMQARLLENLVETNAGMLLVVAFALISVWFVEYKQRRTARLSVQEEFKSMFFGSAGIFLQMSLIMLVIVDAPKYLIPVVIVFLVLMFFIRIFSSNITGMIESLAAYLKKRRGGRKTSDEKSRQNYRRQWRGNTKT